MDNVNLASSRDKLTSAQFETLLRRLHPDRECAGECYEDLRWQLRRFFEWNCGLPAEDLVDETLDRVALKLGELEIHDVVAFAWGVAKNIRHEADKRAARMVPISDRPDEEGFPEQIMDAESEIHERAEREWQLKCLRRCLQRLPMEDRQLFLAYHRPGADSVQARQQLARSLGLTPNALRVRVNRIRDRVEQCTNKYTAAPSREGSADPGKKANSVDLSHE